MRTQDFVAKSAESFVGCRVGLELKNYRENLLATLENYKIDDKANFILTPIAPPRELYYGLPHPDNQIELLPDLVLHSDDWAVKVGITIGQPPLELLEKLFKHALYLPSPLIVIDCPETPSSQKSLAEVINRNLSENSTGKLVLFRTRVSQRLHQDYEPRIHQLHDLDPPSQTKLSKELLLQTNEDSGLTSLSYTSSDNQNLNHDLTRDAWSTWNSLRSLLKPDHRIGVCLEFNDATETDTEEFMRWNGEPVRLVVLHVDMFSATKGFRNMRPILNLREYMRSLALSNSLKTGFVVQAKDSLDMQEHLDCLSNFCDMLVSDHPDIYRAWDDTLLSPLQPLSNNLDSSTYQIFENDHVKYKQYHRAMVQALNHLLSRRSSICRKSFVIMVLGAGRGPLVDAMIRAITGLNVHGVQFKIYALDKNYSSIRSLQYKKVHDWNRHLPGIRTEIVEADMRVWTPEEKADIIATELLGSLSDNELSPECIDGTWRFATPETISIPQSYSSHITPIMSYRMEQELFKSRHYALRYNIRDSLQVVRLSNYYPISEVQELFRYTHYDISNKPVEKSNERDVTLSFTSKVDSVCHGFAGFFSANLFGSVNISTIPANKTPTMESWFSAFIPIESPINIPANVSLVVNFTRKESAEKVWYEWKVMKPIETKVHSLDGNGTSMSKLI